MLNLLRFSTFQQFKEQFFKMYLWGFSDNIHFQDVEPEFNIICLYFHPECNKKYKFFSSSFEQEEI